MAIAVTELDSLSHADLATWMEPRPVSAGRGDLMVQAAVLAVKEAVKPRTEVPDSAKFLVLEIAERGYAPRVQQESLGSRSVSYFQPSDPRSGVFLTEDDLARLGVFELPVGVAWTSAPNGAGGWTKPQGPGPVGRWPWSPPGGTPL